MNKRLLRVLQTMPIQDATWIDCYNNIYDDKVAGTIRTTINSFNMFFIMETKKEEPKVLGWTRDKMEKIENYHQVSVANCVTANKRNNTQNLIIEEKEPFIVASRGREPQVMSPKRTDYGKAIRKDYESHAVTEKRKYMQKLEPREDGISNTSTSVQKDNLVAEPSIIGRPHGYYKGGEYNVSPTVKSSATADNNYVKDVDYRIRKLTPRECFRLMDVDDADIDKLLEAKIPNTQLYKLAGNSIVVAVLERIFDKMFVNTEITDWTLF